MNYVHAVYFVLTFINLYLHWRHNVENKPFCLDKTADEDFDTINRIIVIFNSGLASLLLGLSDPFFFVGFGMAIAFATAALIRKSLNKKRLLQPRE